MKIIAYLEFILFQIFSYILENSTIKTQLLNNIIKFNISGLQYVNFASFSNGDLIFEATYYPYNATRIFFGIKNNGRGFFKNSTTNKEEYYYSMKSQYADNKLEKYESTNLVIKESNNGTKGKEYLMSLSKENSYVEIYDFNNNTIYQKHLKNFIDVNVYSFRHAAIALNSNNNENNYLFCFIGNKD